MDEKQLAVSDSLEANESFREQLFSWRSTGYMCDIKIVTNGSVFDAHAMVISTGSKYLADKIASRSTNVIELDASSSGFEPILEYIYTGKLFISSENVYEVFKCAVIVKLATVEEKIREMILSMVSSASSFVNPSLLGWTLRSSSYGQSIRPLNYFPSNHLFNPVWLAAMQSLPNATANNLSALKTSKGNDGTDHVDPVSLHIMRQYAAGKHEEARSHSGNRVSPAVSQQSPEQAHVVDENIADETKSSATSCHDDTEAASRLQSTERESYKKAEDDQNLEEKRTKMKRSRNDDEASKRKQRVTKPYARSFGASGVGLPSQWRSEVNLASQSPLSSFHHYYPPRASYSTKTAPIKSSSNSLGNLAPQDIQMSSILGLADSQSEAQTQKKEMANEFANNVLNFQSFNDTYDLIRRFTDNPSYPSKPAANRPWVQMNNSQGFPIIDGPGKGTSSQPLHREVELPQVPASGVYSAVRKRTLNSTKPKPFQCQICRSKFTRYHNLKQHVKLHSGVKPYSCKICNKSFTRNYTLKLHNKKHAESATLLRCDVCQKFFQDQNSFQQHIESSHHLQKSDENVKQMRMFNQIKLEMAGDDEGLKYKPSRKVRYGLDSPGGSSGDGMMNGSSPEEVLGYQAEEMEEPTDLSISKESNESSVKAEDKKDPSADNPGSLNTSVSNQ